MWIITQDKIGQDVGRGQGFGHSSEVINHPDRKTFRMKDDDGIIYYYGIGVGGSGFEPLHNFGQPNAGCTSIEYLEWLPL